VDARFLSSGGLRSGSDRCSTPGMSWPSFGASRAWRCSGRRGRCRASTPCCGYSAARSPFSPGSPSCSNESLNEPPTATIRSYRPSCGTRPVRHCRGVVPCGGASCRERPEGVATCAATLVVVGRGVRCCPREVRRRSVLVRSAGRGEVQAVRSGRGPRAARAPRPMLPSVAVSSCYSNTVSAREFDPPH
jgi:hypothetical protein